MPLLRRREGFLGTFALSLSVAAVTLASAPVVARAGHGGHGPAYGHRGGGREDAAVRGEHLQREEGGVEQPVAVLRRGEPATADQRHGKRGHRRSPRLHPDQPPRGRQGSGHRGPARRRYDLSRAGAPVRPGDGPGAGQGRAGTAVAGHRDRHLGRPDGRRNRHHDRQRIRLREHGFRRNHQCTASRRDALGRAGLSQPDPDRRQHQPRKLGRTAHQHQRRADRHQRGGSRRGPGNRLRPADRRGQDGSPPRC